MLEIPILETPRLTLRPHRAGDFADCLRLWSDPAITRYIGGRPFTAEEVWARLLRYAGHWAWMGYGYWVIEDKATGEFAGELGFADHKREIVPPLEGTPELGWVLAAQVHGRGYATEAVRAAVAWGDAHFGAARTVCLIHPDNLKSIRVAEKCGYKELRRTTYKGHPSVLFTR